MNIAYSEHFATANGLRLRYFKWGSDGRPPVVLLHGTGLLAWLWRSTAEALAREYCVYAYDARGHGDSDKTTGYEWPHFIEDLKELLDFLQLRPCTLIGHSLGGCIAANLAARHPEYVTNLVMIEPAITHPIPSQLVPDLSNDEWTLRGNGGENANAARRRRMVWEDADEIVATLRTRPAFARWREDILRDYAERGTFLREDGRLQLKCPGDVEAQVFENGVKMNTWAVLPQMECPTLIIRARHTYPNLFRASAAAATLIPGAKLLTLEDVDHLLIMERPELVVAEILQFLRAGR